MHGISLYRDKPKGKPAAPAETKKQREEKERRAKLAALSKQAFEMRCEFIRSFTACKKHLADIVKFAPVAMFCNYCDREVLNIIADIEKDVHIGSYEKYVEHKPCEPPERTLLIFAYPSAERKNLTYYESHNQKHYQSKTLDLIYDFLSKLGYQMSDEEKALQDGTHEAFAKESK
jgi:ParB family chromosome partitioning protein